MKDGKIDVNFNGGFKIAMKMIVFIKLISYFKNCLSQNQKAFVTFDRQKFKRKRAVSLCQDKENKKQINKCFFKHLSSSHRMKGSRLRSN